MHTADSLAPVAAPAVALSLLAFIVLKLMAKLPSQQQARLRQAPIGTDGLGVESTAHIGFSSQPHHHHKQIVGEYWGTSINRLVKTHVHAVLTRIFVAYYLLSEGNKNA